MPKRILIINTGGTLFSVKSSNGLVPGMSSGDMLEELRMVSKNLELETEDFCSLDSSNIGPEDWTGLATLIARRSYDYQGIVVIHGTDTLAYTSAMLSFMLQNISIPVVVTGSQLSIANPVAESEERSGAVVVILDVTEQQSREELRREFTANVSHELKTPLTSISGYAEIMMNGLVQPSDMGRFSGKIYQEAQRLITLVGDIIRLSQLDE